MLQWVWGLMMALSVLHAGLCGQKADLLAAALEGTSQAIQLTVRLGAGYLLFCGWVRILQELRLPGLLTRVTLPLLGRLMPGCRDQRVGEAVSMNLSMNMLGIGNAATPLGIEAVRLLEERRQTDASAAHDVYMLLILNATSLQLIPTTVLTLRSAAGSVSPGAVIWPGLLCTAVSTAVGAALGLLCRKGRRKL